MLWRDKLGFICYGKGLHYILRAKFWAKKKQFVFSDIFLSMRSRDRHERDLSYG